MASESLINILVNALTITLIYDIKANTTTLKNGKIEKSKSEEDIYRSEITRFCDACKQENRNDIDSIISNVVKIYNKNNNKNLTINEYQLKLVKEFLPDRFHNELKIENKFIKFTKQIVLRFVDFNCEYCITKCVDICNHDLNTLNTEIVDVLIILNKEFANTLKAEYHAKLIKNKKMDIKNIHDVSMIETLKRTCAKYIYENKQLEEKLRISKEEYTKLAEEHNILKTKLSNSPINLSDVHSINPDNSGEINTVTIKPIKSDTSSYKSNTISNKSLSVDNSIKSNLKKGNSSQNDNISIKTKSTSFNLDDDDDDDNLSSSSIASKNTQTKSTRSESDFSVSFGELNKKTEEELNRSNIKDNDLKQLSKDLEKIDIDLQSVDNRSTDDTSILFSDDTESIFSSY